jgi:steroid 5-alpha reductase family enzyme
MTFTSLFGSAGILMLALMTLLWLLSLKLRNTGIVDIFWGTGFIICCWLYFALSPYGYLPRKLLLASMVTVWGLRLSLHILRRSWGKDEDFRYRSWRQEAGASWRWRSYVNVFLLQGILLWVISVPLLVAQIRMVPQHWTFFDYAAVPVWLTGFFFEAAGDWQLSRFRRNPQNKGKVLNTGVWRYTRHPNYFGDALQWWAYFMVAASTGAYWTVFSPAAMTYFLLRVSGVPLLEQSLLETKPGYREYTERTSAFFPLPPRQR